MESGQGACQPWEPWISGKTCATSGLQGAPATSFVTGRVARTKNWRPDFTIVVIPTSTGSLTRISTLPMDRRRRRAPWAASTREG
jgi:hypothetical protein